jgi:hypothetical protein
VHVRRVVTGFDAEGRGCVADDGPAPRTHDFEHIPGFSNTLVWAMSDTTAPIGTPTDITPAVASLMPGASGSALTVVKFPPSSVFASIDAAAAEAEQRAELPGLAERFDPGRPGFHQTDTVDYVIVLQGELWLELERGPDTLLRQGDVVIQNGTPHAWHNRTTEPAVLAAVSVGTFSNSAAVGRGNDGQLSPGDRRDG